MAAPMRVALLCLLGISGTQRVITVACTNMSPVITLHDLPNHR